MSTRRVYEPPVSRDLSELHAVGQVGPMGICVPGSAPGAATCRYGGYPVQDPALCAPYGLAPQTGGCTSGGSPASGCLAGSIPNT